MSEDIDVEFETKPKKADKNKMLPREWASSRIGLEGTDVVVSGAFKDELNKLITEEEFNKKIKSFLDKKANGGN